MNDERSATLADRRDAGGGLFLVGLDVDVDLARGYTSPGQYVEVRAPGVSGYFVLASDPGVRRWELLVRNAGDAADLLVSRPIGSAIDVSRPLGGGVSVPLGTDELVVVAVVGSALALARQVMRLRLSRGHAVSTHLFIGLRAARDLALRDDVAEWCSNGAHVALCLSRAELDHDADILPRARRTGGYVQRAVATHLSSSPFPTPVKIIAGGPDGMLADLRALPGVDVVTNRG